MTEAVKPRRIIDISSPGKTAPNTSSRPILISHKPSVLDPMVSAPVANKTDNQSGESISVSRVSTSVETPAIPVPQPAIQTPAIADQPASPPEPPQISQTNVKQLVHDKTYFVPVAQPPRSRGLPWFLVLVLALIIAAFGAYFILAP